MQGYNLCTKSNKVLINDDDDVVVVVVAAVAQNLGGVKNVSERDAIIFKSWRRILTAKMWLRAGIAYAAAFEYA